MIGSEQKERLIDTIALLSVPGIGRTRFMRLVDLFGSPAEVLKASSSQLKNTPGLSEKIAANLKNECDRDTAGQVAARAGPYCSMTVPTTRLCWLKRSTDRPSCFGWGIRSIPTIS